LLSKARGRRCDVEPIIGTTVEELGAALTVMEDSMKKGEWAKVRICTTSLPTPEELELAGINMALAGFHVSEPETKVIDGISTVTFAVRKGSPEWALLIPIIVPILTIGLITFGIFRIETITKNLLPILLVVGGVVIVTAGLLARPAERVAIKLIERKTPTPQLSLAPSTIPNDKSQRPGAENPSDSLKMLPQTELVDEVKELWRKACEWEKIPPDSKFVVFSENNPYMPAYREAMTKLLRFKQFQSGQWQPAVEGKGRLAERPFEKYQTATSGKFFISQINPIQIKVTRSDRKGEFFIDIGPNSVLPEGPEPSAPTTVEDALRSVVKLTKEEIKRVMKGIPQEIYDTDIRAEYLWEMWEDLEAESSTQTVPLRPLKELPPEWSFLEEEAESIFETKPGMPPPTQTVEREKGWKDFYKGNRVQAMIDSTNWRIKARNVTEDAQKKLSESLKTPWHDLVEYQNLQAYGFASGLLNKAEAEQLYRIYGGESPSPEKWDQLTLAEKVAGTTFAEELLERRLRSGGALPQTSGIRRYWAEKNLPYSTWNIRELWPGGTVRGPFISKPRAVEREEAIAKEAGWTIRRVESPMERFPKQYEALRKLKDYQVLEYHDDGDLTVQSYGQKSVVTTDGEVFAYHTPEEALEKITGDEESAKKKFMPLMMAMAEWYAKNMRPITLEDMRPISNKYLTTSETMDDFYRYLATARGKEAFLAELDDAMRRHGRKAGWTPFQLATEPGGEVVEMYCQRCGKKVPSPSSFRTPENMRIFMITGLCQECQDIVSRPNLPRILPFSGFKDNELVWSGAFPDVTFTVTVKDFYSTPKLLIENALKNSRADLSNIVTNHELLFAGAGKGEVWWLSTIGNLPVEVHVHDITNFSEIELEDIFNNSVATIRERPSLQPATEEMEKYYRELAAEEPRPGWVKATAAGRDNYSGWEYPAGTWVVRVTQAMFAKELPPFLNNVYVLPWSYDEMVGMYHRKGTAQAATTFGEYILKMDRVGNITVTNTADPGKDVFLQFQADKELVTEILNHDELKDLESGWEVKIMTNEPRASVLSELWQGAQPMQKQPAVIPNQPPKEPGAVSKLQFVADSPEYLAQTIDMTGWRQRIDQVFQEAVQRVGGTKEA
jgi:hypothetical protein